MPEQVIHDFLNSFILPDWETLPDFGLYLDQVMGFIERTVPRLDDSLMLTRSMVNNYVKLKLVDPPKGKKYSRESLSQLLMIRELKQIFTIDTMRELLHPDDCTDTHAIYAIFQQAQRENADSFRSSGTPLQFALEAAACHALCILKLQQEKTLSCSENQPCEASK